jgi:hypothetical protein
MTGSSPRLTCCAASHPHFILFTTPVYLNSIPLECRTCPICAEPYIEPSKSRPNLEDTDEWAMRVDMSATDAGSRKCCGHIFGRRCLEKHINSHGAWHNKCPLCRQEWWTTNPKELPQHRPRWPRNEQDDSNGSVRRQDLLAQSSFVRQVLDVFACEGGRGRGETGTTVQD